MRQQRLSRLVSLIHPNHTPITPFFYLISTLGAIYCRFPAAKIFEIFVVDRTLWEIFPKKIWWFLGGGKGW